MRKLLGILTGVAVLSSCGGGGLGTGMDVEGGYYLTLQAGVSGDVVRVVDYSTDDSGYVVSYSIPSYPEFLDVIVGYNYEGETFEDPLNMRKCFLKKVEVTYGEGKNAVTKTYYYNREIGNGLDLKFPLTSADLVRKPFIFANALEDRTFTVEDRKDFTKQDFWDSDFQSASWEGQELDFTLPQSYRNLKIVVGNTLCLVNDDGTLSAPCTGSVENGVVRITGIDSAYLVTNHETQYTYKGASGEFTLSSGITPGSVRISFGNDENSNPVNIALTDDGNGNLVDGQGNVLGSVNYDTGVITITLGDRAPSFKEAQEVEFWAGWSDTGSYSANGRLRPFTISLEAYSSTPSDPDNSPVGYCSDDGLGHLVGDCTGTVNYDTGEISYDWNLSSDAGSTLVKYTKLVNQYLKVDFTADWETADENANVGVGYDYLRDDAPTTFAFAVPPKTEFSHCKFYSDGELIPGVDYTTTVDSGYLYVHLLNVPERDLWGICYFKRTFDFNPNVTVDSYQSPMEIPVKVKVYAVLETGEKLSAEQTMYVTLVGDEENFGITNSATTGTTTTTADTTGEPVAQ